MSAGLLDPEPGAAGPGGSAPGGSAPGGSAVGGPAPGGTAVGGVTPAQVWQWLRGPLLVIGAVLAVVLVTAVVAGRAREGRLDPVATDPGGARALAVLLEDRGVPVERVTSLDAALAGGADATVVVPFPQALPDVALRALAASDRDLVVIAPDGPSLDALAPGLEVAASTGAATRPPSCDLPAARIAGPVEIGGLTYDTAGVDGGAGRTGGAAVTACYEASGGALLVRTDRPGGGATTVLGDGAPLTNDRLDVEGNAALALLLLGTGDEVRWLMAAPGAQEPEEPRGLVDLLPTRVRAALLVLTAAVVVAALWRARRLGPVVREPLPVVVRAAETVEGRARLYRASRARDRAAEALRAASRARLTDGLGTGADPDPAVLVAAVAARVGLEPAAVGSLLYGPVPADDRALVRLAADLDALEARTRAPSGPVASASPAVADSRGPA